MDDDYVLVLATSRDRRGDEGGFTADSVAELLADMGPDEWIDVHHNGSRVDNAARLDRALAEAGISCRREEAWTPTDSISRIDGVPTTHNVRVRYYGAGQGTA